MKKLLFIFAILSIIACKNEQVAQKNTSENEFVWQAANLYFLLTDRFHNGDISNDLNFDRTKLLENSEVLKEEI